MRKAVPFVVIAAALVLSAVRPASAKFLAGVSKISNMYLVVTGNEYIDSKEIELKVFGIFRKYLPDIRFADYGEYQKSDSPEKNITVFLNFNTLESSRASGKGIGYVTSIDMKVGIEGYDEIGTFKKIYWSKGIISACTHKDMIFEKTSEALETLLATFIEEWKETQSLWYLGDTEHK